MNSKNSKKNSFYEIFAVHRKKLPEKYYFSLHNLFEGNKSYVNSVIYHLWNESGFEVVWNNSHVWKSIEPLFKRPERFPSRVFRNILELGGRTIRSQGERKEVFDLIWRKSCLVLYPEWEIKEHFGLKSNPLLIYNVCRQVKNLISKGEKIESYFDLKPPEFKGTIMLTGADDSIENGQFKKLRVTEEKIELEIKLPGLSGWKWEKIEFETPERVRRLLASGFEVRAPLLHRERNHRGEEFYLILVFSKTVERKSEDKTCEPDKVFALDLCPSMKRLAVGVIMDKTGRFSKPVYFKAEKFVRKILRIRGEISNLKSRIDKLYRERRKTGKESIKEFLRKKIDHLYREIKSRERKLKNLRKEIVEILVNEILLIARIYELNTVVVEKLSFKEVPSWKDKTLRWLFSTWFYSRFMERLEYKAKLNGIQVIRTNPANTSKTCFCGEKAKKESLYLVCPVHGRYNKDYVAAVNIGKRYLKSSVLEVGDIPEAVPSGDTSSSFIQITTLMSYLSLVKCTLLINLFLKLIKIAESVKYCQLRRNGKKWCSKFCNYSNI